MTYYAHSFERLSELRCVVPVNYEQKLRESVAARSED
jgi:hypothetical protein